MNVDAKIASKALATWMKSILSSVIKSYQTGYVAGRCIEESIHLIRDILRYVDENKLSGIFLSLTLRKCSIQLRILSFCNSSILWIWTRIYSVVSTFLKDVESCVLNNGLSTGYFHWKVEPGKAITVCISFSSFVQKHCLSKFVIMIILGILGHEIKLSAYADDADFLTPDTDIAKTRYTHCDIKICLYQTSQIYYKPHNISKIFSEFVTVRQC